MALTIPIFPASVERWRPRLIAHASDFGLSDQINFLLAWIKRESAGNICSYTTLRESGIFQLMPPDNTNRGGTTEAKLRAACSGSSQTQARTATDDELDEQVISGLRYIQYLVGVAHQKLVKAGVTWDETNPDFWRIVKLQHAYPGPTATWLNAAATKLGRPAASWDEMVAYGVPAGGYQSVIANAGDVGAYGGGSALSSGGWAALFVGLGLVAGVWWWMSSKRPLKLGRELHGNEVDILTDGRNWWKGRPTPSFWRTPCKSGLDKNKTITVRCWKKRAA